LGAATLLIGAAIVLPMVLDQAPRSLNSDIVINMPGAADSASPAAVPAPAVPAVEAAAPAPAVAAATDKPEAASKAQTDAVAAESHSADAAQQKKTAKQNGPSSRKRSSRPLQQMRLQRKPDRRTTRKLHVKLHLPRKKPGRLRKSNKRRQLRLQSNRFPPRRTCMQTRQVILLCSLARSAALTMCGSFANA
jgi:hypothetical protein